MIRYLKERTSRLGALLASDLVPVCQSEARFRIIEQERLSIGRQFGRSYGTMWKRLTVVRRMTSTMREHEEEFELRDVSILLVSVLEEKTFCSVCCSVGVRAVAGYPFFISVVTHRGQQTAKH